jgi:predicted nucleic acid-binding protein
MRRVLVDTGPLVAILSNSDLYHKACVNVLRSLPAPLYSCWPALTEAAWLLRNHPSAVQRLLNGLEDGFLALLPLGSPDAKAIADVMSRYEDIRPQLADAALVHLATREGIDTIFTLDRRDFSVYRSGRRRAFHILPDLP